jgi:hypothetical protein
MKKTTVFLITFLISFLTIYSLYYYSQLSKLDQSVVAKASDLHKTVYGMSDSSNKNDNMIWTKGIDQILNAGINDTGHFLSNVPDDHFVSFNDAKNKANLEKFYENLVTKYQNHPPLAFDDVKDGQKILFSYFFHNMRLPEGFRVSERKVFFHDTYVRSLQYRSGNTTDTSSVAFFKKEASREYAFRVKLNNGTEEAIAYSSPVNTSWKDEYKSAAAFCSTSKYRYSPAKDESVLLPELDFNIIKDYTFKEQDKFPLLKDYALVEERIKLKMSAPKEGGPLEVNKKFNTPKNYILDGNIIIFIRKIRDTNPYCMILVRNSEILKAVTRK